jgi:hypothetical protein
MRAMSLVATEPGDPRPGIPARFIPPTIPKKSQGSKRRQDEKKKESGYWIVALDKRRIIVDPENPPKIFQNRIYAASPDIKKNSQGGTQLVLSSPKEQATNRIMLFLILPDSYQFKRHNYEQILLRNRRKNTQGLILVANPGFLVRVTSRRLDIPQYIYVTHDLQVIFGNYDEVNAAGAFR